jgi:hypothetical protein
MDLYGSRDSLVNSSESGVSKLNYTKTISNLGIQVCMPSHPFIDPWLCTWFSRSPSLIDDIEQLCIKVKCYLVSFVRFIRHCSL